MCAWRLAKAGHEVIALEQYRLDHDKGSSFGDSRIVRRVYPDPFYTKLMARSYELWDELMTDSHDPNLFVKSGGIFVGDSGNPEIISARKALLASGVKFEDLNRDDCLSRFPAFPLRENEIALFEPSMGYARASLTLKAATKCARKFGAKILVRKPVTQITKGAAGFVIKSGVDEFSADRVLVTAGPWMNSLLKPLGLTISIRVTRQPYLCLEPMPGMEPDFEQDRFPVWIDADTYAYGFPKLGENPGVKIGMHAFGKEVSPENVERELSDGDRRTILEYAEKRFPGLSKKIVYEKVCLYTRTKNEDFIIDEIPGMSGAFFLSPCSGHGFKFTPLMGEIGAELAISGDSTHDLSRFRINNERVSNYVHFIAD